MTNLTEKVKTNKPTCEQCMNEVPSSAVHSTESTDYVHHFCGLECYAEWKKKKEQNEETERKATD